MAVLASVRDAGIDIEVNSGGELYKALRVGFRPDQIIFNGTSKTTAEIDEAVRASVYAINVDSIYEIEMVEEAARRLRTRARISIRLVPEIVTLAPGAATALLTSKFASHHRCSTLSGALHLLGPLLLSAAYTSTSARRPLT